MGSKKSVDMTATDQKIKIVKAGEPQTSKSGLKKEVKTLKKRSKKYFFKKNLVDKSKRYDAFAGIELIKKLSYTKFDGTITAHAVLREVGEKFELSFPYSTGKITRVAVVDDELVKKIEEGQIEFDVLICHPQDMSKIMKLARVLGPKGLMPNPKNGTVTTEVELKKKELEAGKILVKTEKKAPLIHVAFGKVSFNTKDLVENLKALVKKTQGKMTRLSISATMSPGVKIDLTKFE
jgi:large subunit ribosomal protein L1